MKCMKQHEERQPGFKEAIARKVGERLAKMSEVQGGCRLLTYYEPEMPEALIKEMLAKR